MRRAPFLPFVVLALLAAVQLAAFWPGVVVWDSIRQYGQAVSGAYDDWHPPAMSWLWRQLGAVAAGPAPMLVTQWGSYWGGFAMIVASLGGRRARWGVVACAVLPVPFLLVGTVLKDSVMAGALLLAAGLVAVPRRRGWHVVGAGALLLAAATLRFNAVFACLPLAVLLVPERWRRGWRLAVTLACAALPLAAALPIANRALGAAPSGVESSLIVYDLAGITRWSGADAFPPLAVADPVAINAKCWSPVSWDRYAWWGPDPCAIQFADVRAAIARTGRSPYRWWAGAVAAHPLAYARHRLLHANAEARWWVRGDDLPRMALKSDPNPWGFRVADGPVRRAVGGVADWSLDTPLGWPAVFVALAIACLVVRPGGGLGAALAWSALLYAGSFAGLGVASEVRYHFWTDTAAALATVLTLAARPGAPAWRWWLAGALVAGVTGVAVLARV